jgi:outer membrane protein
LSGVIALSQMQSVYAQDSTPVEQSIKLTIEQVFTTVNQLILSNQLQAAKGILVQLEHAKADPIQIRFLRGMIAGAEGDWKTAAANYRTILANNPELLRVRLELARALYELKDGDNAKRQFEMVLASKNLPPSVVENIRLFLSTIYTQKHWSLSMTLNAAPDTNINAATGSDRVILFGLPFELSDDAKKSSGVGLTGDVRAGYRFDLGKGKALDVGANIRHTEYLNSGTFDQTFLQGQIGPRFYTNKSEIRLVATVGYSRFGGSTYYNSYGGQISAQRQITDRFKLSAVLSGEQMDYKFIDGKDGHVLSIVGQGDYSLSRISATRAYMGVSKEFTFDDSLENTSFRAGASYVRELSLGLTVNLNANAALRPYKGISFLYGVKRRDHSYGAGIGFTKRDFTILGFAPVISYDYLSSRSNIDFFTYNRHRVNIGFTHIF